MHRAEPSVRVARAGNVFFGAPVGVLLLDCVAPFIPGSVGNASSYSVPVRYKTVPGCTVERALFEPDDAVEAAVVETARELEEEGARVITANCGFMIRFEEAVKRAVDTPVLLSSLLLVPFLRSVLPPHRALGIITASERSLTPDLLALAGVPPDANLAIAGLEASPAFRAAFIDCTGELDIAGVRDETTSAVVDLLERRPDVGAVLLECSELPPYAAAVQDATGLPVFDFLSMIEFFATGLHRSEFKGPY